METNQKRYPDLGSKESSKWNFRPRSQGLSVPLAPQGRVGEDPGNEVVEFLHSFLVSRAGKPVEASPNVCCFLRLHVIYLRYLPCSIHSIPVTRVHSNSPVDDINRIRAKVVLKLHK